MNNQQSKTAPSGAVIEIDIFKILADLWKNILLIVLAALIGGAAMLSYSFFLVKPSYSANVLVYVNKGSVSISDMSLTLSNSEDVLNTYITILKSRTTLKEVIDTAGVPYTVKELKEMITVNSTSADKSNFLDIDVSSSDPAEAELIANTIATVLPTRVADIVDGSSLRVVDYAVMPSQRTSTSLIKNAAIGAFAGAFLVCAAVAVGSIVSSNHAPMINSASDLATYYPDYPVLGIIRDLSYSDKKYAYSNSGYNKYSYYYNRDNQPKMKASASSNDSDRGENSKHAKRQ